MSKAGPQPMSNETRKRLWWKATRMSFNWVKWRDQEKGRTITRQDWARLIYRIFVQYPEEALVPNVGTEEET